MRVTKTVKEYISKKVAEKYKPRINEVGLDYKLEKEKLNKKIESAVKRFEEELNAIVADNCQNYNFQAPVRFNEQKILSWYEVLDKEAENEHYHMKRHLEEEKNEKIENIIVELELGGTRETLEKMLNEI